MARKIDFTKQPADVQLAAHAIGLDHKRPYIRQGKAYFRPWRNYYNTSYGTPEWEVWEELYEKCYADILVSVNNLKQWRYILTRAGLDWLGETLGIIINYEED